MNSNLVLWGWEKKKRTMLRYIKAGDVFCFQYDENTFCFGRIMKIMENFATIAEIFDYISDEPVITMEDIDRGSRMFPPVNLDVHLLFDRKFEGEWRMIGRYEDFELVDVDDVFFTYGDFPAWKLDLYGNETAITLKEAETLVNLLLMRDCHVKEMVHAYLHGEPNIELRITGCAPIIGERASVFES